MGRDLEPGGRRGGPDHRVGGQVPRVPKRRVPGPAEVEGRPHRCGGAGPGAETRCAGRTCPRPGPTPPPPGCWTPPFPFAPTQACPNTATLCPCTSGPFFGTIVFAGPFQMEKVVLCRRGLCGCHCVGVAVVPCARVSWGCVLGCCFVVSVFEGEDWVVPATRAPWHVPRGTMGLGQTERPPCSALLPPEAELGPCSDEGRNPQQNRGWADPRTTARSQCSVKHPGHRAGAHATHVTHEAHAACNRRGTRPAHARPTEWGSGCGGRPGQRVQEQSTWA